MRRARRVNMSTETVVKLTPSAPPRRGDRVLVDGVVCRVTRCRVYWREPGVWKITDLRVKAIR